MDANGPTWRIGIDEAGYGPNLGPLAIGATAWRMPRDGDLYETLAGAVSSGPTDDDRLVIADSKAVYQPGGGLSGLELAVLACVPRVGKLVELIDTLQADPQRCRESTAWRVGFDPEVPIDADTASTEAGRDRLQQACNANGVEPPLVLARLVYPAEFNELVDRYGTKGAALSHVTLGLLRRMLDHVGIDSAEPDADVRVTLDKHGGRNRYAALVQHWLPDPPLAVLEESRPVSRYRLGERIELVFRSKGEAELPVALASMTAKLLRELSMRGFNAYWAEQVPGVRPTAGYPLDAKRFKADIAEKQRGLGIDDHTLWRNR